MFKSTNKIYFLYFCFDLAIISLSFFIPYLLRFNFDSVVSFNFNNLFFPNLKEYAFIFVLWSILIINALKSKNLYSTDRTITIPREIYLVLTSLTLVSIVIAAIIFFTKFHFFSRLVFIYSFACLSFFLTSWRIIKKLILRYLIGKGFHNFNVLIVGLNYTAQLLIEEIRSRPFLGFKLVGAIVDSQEKFHSNVPILGDLDNFEKICKKYFIDEIFISTPFSEHSLSKISKIAKRMNVGIRIIPPNFQEAFSSIDINYLGLIPLLTYKEREIYPSELALKRMFDFFTSLVLLILFLPLFLIVGVIIKLDSPGPIFYAQKRMGRKERFFNFYKFRSMVKDADELKTELLERNEVRGGVIFKIERDPRITRVGSILRKYSLDELPQFFNVLKGDMSLVGPRPFPVEESQKLHFNQVSRLNIRPGITGLSQIRGRSDLSVSRWIKWDLWYINNWSFGLDLLILLWTIPAVLKRKGAY